MVLHDQHIHSKYSMDSEESLRTYYDLAKKNGCSYLITTEHIDLDTTYSQCDWVVDYDSLIKEYETLPNDITKLLGIEIGYRKDKLDELIKWSNKYPYDLINFSIHDSGEEEYYYYDYFLKKGVNKVLDIYFDQMIDGIKTFKNYDVLSHIDYGLKTVYLNDPLFDFTPYDERIKEVFKIIIQDGKALEINTKVQHVFPDSHLEHLLDMYKELGGTKLTLSSDAHKGNRYLETFDHYKQIIKNKGFNYLCYYIKRKEYHFDI